MEYPIYRWSLTVEHDYGEEHYQGSKMFKIQPSDAEEEDFMQLCWNNAVAGREFITVKIEDETGDEPERFEHIAPQDMETLHIVDTEFEYLGDDEWCLTWFAHYTFDTGQTDEEILKSFNRFVNKYMNEIKKTQSSLMGAEDRWRWAGLKYPDGKNAAAIQVDPPCRCEFCKEAGVIRIQH
jgi:hypothetical protein